MHFVGRRSGCDFPTRSQRHGQRQRVEPRLGVVSPRHEHHRTRRPHQHAAEADEHWGVRANAISVLGRLKDEKALPVLIDALGASNQWVRDGAAIALAHYRAKAAPAVRFEATLYTIDGLTIFRLPEKASNQLPSRGQVAVQATVNGHACQTVVEPDGESGHWVRIDAKQQRAAALRAGDTAEVELVPLEDWPEPMVPRDLQAALAAAPDKIQELWKDITPMARWEWVRWVNATRNPGTRQRRVEVSISKMQSGKRRPCCFNLAACTDPNLSKNGKLINP